MTERVSKAVPPGMPRWAKRLLTLLIIVVAAVFMWSQLPRGSFPDDLSRIGTGRPALVLVQDNNYMGGMLVMDLLREVRDDYQEVEFLVARQGTPEGIGFARHYGVDDGSVLLFAADGRQLALKRQPESTAELHQLLAPVRQQP